jgi:ATPase
MTAEPFPIESFFDETTMSVHLKVGTRPKAKGGELGNITYGPIDEEPVSEEQMVQWEDDIELLADVDPAGFTELREPGVTVLQVREYRVAIARPPFSDALEITAVRPIAKPSLDEYDIPEQLRERFTAQERGVLIAGAPGQGKSTFAQAVGEYLDAEGFVVKTMEQPRDLQVNDDITQYTAVDGSMEKTADALLLVRPDYTIYDEVRKTSDFSVFADMRLAGVGMIGVVHASRAIDALQRLVGRVELGLIPQVVDTIVYIEAGEVHTLYTLRTEVKVPAGMNAEDLARPVVHVEEFESGEPVFEVYTFNGQVVTVDLDDIEDSTAESAEGDEEAVLNAIRSVVDGDVHVVMQRTGKAIVYVERGDISRVIGNNGSQVSSIEDRLGVSLDVRTHEERPKR